MKQYFKLNIPVAILLSAIIIGIFFFATKLIKQKSIEKQQQISIIEKRKAECYQIEQIERKNYNNVDGSFYEEKFDICKVRYLNDKWRENSPGSCPIEADFGFGLDLDKTKGCTITQYSYKVF